MSIYQEFEVDVFEHPRFCDEFSYIKRKAFPWFLQVSTESSLESNGYFSPFNVVCDGHTYYIALNEHLCQFIKRLKSMVSSIPDSVKNSHIEEKDDSWLLQVSTESSLQSNGCLLLFSTLHCMGTHIILLSIKFVSIFQPFEVEVFELSKFCNKFS